VFAGVDEREDIKPLLESLETPIPTPLLLFELLEFLLLCILRPG